MSRLRQALAPGIAVLALVPFAALAGAGEEPSELERARSALERARSDLAEETARGEASRAEAAGVVSAALARREAATRGLARARKTQRELESHSQVVHSEIDRLAGLSQDAEAEIALVRDVLHQALGDAHAPALGDAHAEEPGETDTAALAARIDDPEGDLGKACKDEVLSLEASARAARTPLLATEDVEVEGRGRVHGRVLRAGPCAWLASGDLEAVAVASQGGLAPGPFVPCRNAGIGRAEDAFEKGERSLVLPVILRAPAVSEHASAIDRVTKLLVQGGLAMAPLAVLSLLGLFVFLERLLKRRRTLASARSLVGRVAASLSSNDRAHAEALARESEVLGGALRLWIAGDVPGATDSLRSSLLGELRGRLWLLGTVGSSAPFVGLFGTVVGIIRAFEDIGTRGSAGFAVVASGISEALVATAAGIVVAVIAMIAYNALQAAATREADAVARSLELAQARGAPT